MSASTADMLLEYTVVELLGRPFDGDPLASGELDSLATELLIAFIEDEFAVEFVDAELTMENFASLAVLADLVDNKRAAPESGPALPDGPPPS
jgi:acyl carrier protein